MTKNLKSLVAENSTNYTGIVFLFTAITCDASNWPTPSNGYSSCSGLSKVKSGTICTVTCNRGYKISGSPSSRCDNDGRWYPNATSNCQGEKKAQL